MVPKGIPVLIPETVHALLYDKRDLPDLIKVKIIIQWDPNCDHKCPGKSKAEGGLTLEKGDMAAQARSRVKQLHTRE